MSTIECKYCHKIRSKAHITRHYRTCKAKQIMDARNKEQEELKLKVAVLQERETHRVQREKDMVH